MNADTRYLSYIPFNVPGEAIKRYLDLSEELAYR